jgi:hypothetical protein
MMRFDVSWLRRDHGTAAERAAFADIRISVDDVVLTEVYDASAQTRRESVRLSALRLATWLLENWWRLSVEPRKDLRVAPDWRMAHALPAAGEGLLWPPLEIASDGETVLLTSTMGRQSRQAKVIYQCEGVFAVPLEDFQAAVDDFVRLVRARLVALGVTDSHLDALSVDLATERNDPQLSRLRQAEALLGLDSDTASPSLAALLDRAAHWGPVASGDILAGSTVETLPAVLDSIDRLDAPALRTLDISALRSLAVPTPGRGASWQRGHVLARAIRRGLGNERAPLDIDALALNHMKMRPDAPAFSVALRDDADKAHLRVALGGRHPTSQRFQAACLVGSALQAGTEILIVANRSGTAHQKIQRAFAQELLIPVAAIKERVGDGDLQRDDLIEDLADEYGVSTVTIQAAMVNHGLVPFGEFGPLGREPSL